MLCVHHQFFSCLFFEFCGTSCSLGIHFLTETVFSFGIQIEFYRMRGRTDTICPPVREISSVYRNIFCLFFYFLEKLLQSRHLEMDLSFIIFIQFIDTAGDLFAWRSIVCDGSGYHEGNHAVRIFLILKIMQIPFNSGMKRCFLCRLFILHIIEKFAVDMVIKFVANRISTAAMR